LSTQIREVADTAKDIEKTHQCKEMQQLKETAKFLNFRAF
jgi:hypothetical protein